MLGRRALVHFAVDPDEVAMTTKLDGQRTQFLPFNLGSRRRAGNPPNPDGYRTAYLWERVWQRDAWLDLLGRFMHVDVPREGLEGGAAQADEGDLPALPPVGRRAQARGRRARARCRAAAT